MAEFSGIVLSLEALGHQPICAADIAADLSLRFGPADAGRFLCAENILDAVLLDAGDLVRFGGIEDIINASFELPPEKLQEFFKSKGYTPTWSWRDMWQEAHFRSFTVAKAMQMDILLTIREQIHRAIDEGTTFRDFAKALEPALKAQGWWGRQDVENPRTGQKESVQLGSWARLETIYRTNLAATYMKGRYDGMLSVAPQRPFWQYSAIVDPSTRPKHKELHGRIFRYDNPIWNTIYPPNAYGCRCHVSSLSEREMQRDGLKPSKSADFKNWKAEENFNHSPRDIWKPKKEDYPPEYWEYYKREMKQAGLWQQD